MEFSFSAERKLVFTVSAGGRNLLVEFSDRNSGGRSSFTTTDARVAQAVRRTSLSRRGVIIETTMEEQPQQAPKTIPDATGRPDVDVSTESSPAERSYDNFTQAREAITREFGIMKSDVRNPTALAQFAKEKGFTIKYNNAEG